MVKTVTLPKPRPVSEFSTFGEWLRSIYESKHGAGRIIAEAAGVKPATVVYWCRGKIPKRASLIRLADAFRVSRNELLQLAHQETEATGSAPAQDEAAETAEMLQQWNMLRGQPVVRRAMIEHMRTFSTLIAATLQPPAKIAHGG